jgi:hypothetical protein
VPKYQYNGDVERFFPTLGKIVKKGDVFDAPDGLVAPGLSLAEPAKTAPAASAPKEKEKTKEEPKPSASSDSNAGA